MDHDAITLSDFFRGSETTLGIFYPTHHLIAVFETQSDAQHAAEALRSGGFPQAYVIAVSGRDVIELSKTESGLGSFFMQALSRFFGTEQKYTDHDLDHARHGAGFLAVRCPTEHAKQLAWKRIELLAPLDARYYASGGIEHLAGDFDTD
jgi:hypothetical protein